MGNTSTSTETRYVYDNLSQLIREDNGKLGKTYTYTYDNAGNITSKKTYALTAASATPTNPTATQTYGYTDEDWGDLLTSRNGVTVTYDSLGNPMHYNRFDLIWEGRKLVRAISDDAEDYGYNDLEYEYNDDGLLIGKTELYLPYYHEFYYDGDRMIAEVWESEALFFLYDSTGVIGMQYWYETELIGTYWFEKNLQGDVVAVYGNDGTLYSTYAYDAWGNQTTTVHNPGGMSSPFGYRGYYYDGDLGLYYLQSRYYDPATGRFISPDDMSYLGANGDIPGYNLYAYCSNNPIMYTDPRGHFISSLLYLAASIHDACQLVLGFNVTVTENEDDPSQNNVKIENSYRLITPWGQYGYAFYLNHFRDDTKDVLKGSTLGIQFEWAVHNLANLGLSLIGQESMAESARSVDIGGTIWHDNHPEGIESVMSLGMKVLYCIRTPIFAILDAIVCLTEE